MSSKDSRFILGIWGLRVCSLDIAFVGRNRSQPSATVRNRPQPSATVCAIPVWPCLWEIPQRWSFLAVSDKSLLRFAWQRGTLWHSHVFWNASKVVCVAGAIFLRRCQKMYCNFRGRHNTLDVSIVIFRGRRHFQTCRVACFLQIALAGLCQVATRCKFRGNRGILYDILKINGNLARNVDFEVTKFRALRKIRRKMWILKLQKWKNWRKFRTKCSFGCSHLSRLAYLVFRGLAVSMGEDAKFVLLLCCQL